MNKKSDWPPWMGSATLQARPLGIALSLYLFLAACSGHGSMPGTSRETANLAFGPEQGLGHSDNNPSTPFLRYSPDGRLFATWTEADHSSTQKTHSGTHQHHESGKMVPSPMRNAILAASIDDGKTWSSATQVNRSAEAIQEEENGPKVALGRTTKLMLFGQYPAEKAIRLGPTSALQWKTKRAASARPEPSTKLEMQRVFRSSKYHQTVTYCWPGSIVGSIILNRASCT